MSETDDIAAPKAATERPIDAIRGLEAVKSLPSAPRRNRPRTAGSRREQRSIAKVRSEMAKLLEDSAPKFQQWFEQAVAENPLKALVLLKDLLEFYMPKLGRVEQVGTVEHKVSHFVPVVEREAPPEAIEGVFTSLPQKTP